MTDWPEGNKHLGFWELTAPVCKAIREAYDIEPRDYGDRVMWSGPSLPEMMAATCLPYDESLTREHLERDENDQGRDPLEVIVGIAIQLGMEQQRRKVAEDDPLGVPIQMLEFSLDQLRRIAKRGESP